jgi:hypothetical protein
MKYIKLMLLVFLLPFSVEAQISFSEFGAGLSSWTRLYSTPDETILLVDPTQGNGSANTVLVPSVYGKLDLGKTFSLRGRVGYAQNTFESVTSSLGDLVRIEKIEQNIIPAGLQLEYRFPLSKSSKSGTKADLDEGEASEKSVDPSSKSYFIGGLGISRYFIQHTISREVIGGEGSLPASKFSGNDFGFTAMVGYSTLVSERLVLTLFSQFNTGSYDHRVYSEDSIGAFEVQNISLQGLEFGVTIGFKLK